MRKPEDKITYQVTRAYEKHNILIARVQYVAENGIAEARGHIAVILDDSGMQLWTNRRIRQDQFKFKAFLAHVTLIPGQPSRWLLEEAEFIE